MEPKYNYDFFVIGGGPGGNAAAKEASKYDIKVGLADFVQPSPKGTSRLHPQKNDALCRSFI